VTALHTGIEHHLNWQLSIALRLLIDIGFGGKLLGVGADLGRENHRPEDGMGGSLIVCSGGTTSLYSCTRLPNPKN
jgi:hypothetical protein